MVFTGPAAVYRQPTYDCIPVEETLQDHMRWEKFEPMQGNGQPFITALIATMPRWRSLTEISLPSVLKQSRRPDCLLIVSDQRPFADCEVTALRDLAEGIHLHLLCNQLAPGAAGTWNTGLSWLRNAERSGYVAILDDDDEWDSAHLKCCEATGVAAGGADIVLSGLRVMKAGTELSRTPLARVSREDFLAGNPGWQGSNTFVKLSTMARVGGFTNGLPSANDRDLAVRLLSVPDITVAFTNEMTASWHMDSQPDALSRRGGPEKREGLAWFLRMHGHLMTPDIRARFLARARDLFDVELEVVEADHAGG